MLHELGTNSVIYGALLRAEGAVSVGWSVDDDRLRLEWRERGGPPVKSPFRRGYFGTNLIEQTAKSEGGGSHVHAEADGIRGEITLPLKTDRAIVPESKPASPRVRSVPRQTGGDGGLQQKLSRRHCRS
jgi:two-component sensor histidine kinase